MFVHKEKKMRKKFMVTLVTKTPKETTKLINSASPNETPNKLILQFGNGHYNLTAFRQYITNLQLLKVLKYKE